MTTGGYSGSHNPNTSWLSSPSFHRSSPNGGTSQLYPNHRNPQTPLHSRVQAQFSLCPQGRRKTFSPQCKAFLFPTSGWQVHEHSFPSWLRCPYLKDTPGTIMWILKHCPKSRSFHLNSCGGHQWSNSSVLLLACLYPYHRLPLTLRWKEVQTCMTFLLWFLDLYGHFLGKKYI